MKNQGRLDSWARKYKRRGVFAEPVGNSVAMTDEERLPMADHTKGRIVSRGLLVFLTWIAVLLLGNQVFSQTPSQKVTLSHSSSGITSIEFLVLRWGLSETDLGRSQFCTLGEREAGRSG